MRSSAARRELANPHYDGKPLTDFASITPATPLESLNLNWRERDLPERVRTKHVHRLHPYLGKFIPNCPTSSWADCAPEWFASGCAATVAEVGLGIGSRGLLHVASQVFWLC